MSYLIRDKIEKGWRVKIVEDGTAYEATTASEWEALPQTPVEASVPGDWILDYVRAGIFPDPYFGDNFTKLYDYERYHAVYLTEFEADRDKENAFLLFEGIDTVADIFLNGKKIGRTENMFIEHEIPARGLRKGKNELIVRILPVCLEAKKYEITPPAATFKYNYPGLVIRKAMHSFGWDICPRIVGGGIWKPVFLVEKRKDRIENIRLVTNGIDKSGANLTAVFDVQTAEGGEEYEIEISGECADSSFSVKEKATSKQGRINFTVAEPKIWSVKGYGKPNLYDVTARLVKGGKEVDKTTFRYGIRTIELIRDDVTSKDKRGEFVFLLNGNPIYIKGTNWVPCDAFHSRDAERTESILDLVEDCGCNALRVWGGGVYESDLFYDLCDERGIFVWQDFMMACSVYPRDSRMQELIRTEATAVVRRLRNHPSLCLWAGDNECDLAYLGWFGEKIDPESNVLTRKILPEVIEKEDGSRPYLPSSPYMSPEAVKRKVHAPEQHLWGPRKYFKGAFYRENDATFASEMGYHGCCGVESIKKFIPKEYLWGYKNNKMWLYHASSPELKNSPYAYRIGLMARQIRYFFGERPLTLESFSEKSQIVQAEAKKYFIESFRCRMGERTGLIWWNVMDCWPQFSDAVVDWYYKKKLAYYYIRNSQQPLCLMMDKIGGTLKLFAVSDLDENTEIEYTITVTGKTVAAGKALALSHSSTLLAELSGRGRKFFVVSWKTAGGKEGKNHYLLGRPFFACKWYKKQMEKSGVNAEIFSDKDR